jgi:hypothetical protein
VHGKVHFGANKLLFANYLLVYYNKKRKKEKKKKRKKDMPLSFSGPTKI